MNKKSPSCPKLLVLGLAAAFLASASSAAQRPFLMGTSISSNNGGQFSFENLPDKDLLSLHIDDFLGIPWSAFQNGTTPPAAWVTRWTAIQSGAATSGKVIYLAVSPLSGRITLANNIDANGNTIPNWAPTDSSGCYAFSTDSNAAIYKQAYINYAKWVINLIHPTYFSPAIEINIQFAKCPAQKASYIQWYSDVHQALKTAYPDLVVFPTFQMQFMDGLADPVAWCGGVKTDASLAACFQQRLSEAASIPADRVAFSFYPSVWNYPPTAPDSYTPGFPYEQYFSRVQQATRRKIWISETGWPAVQVYSAYQHTSPPSSCGFVGLPSPQVAGEPNMAIHMTQLLAQAQSKQLEAVVWWENQDFLDATIASQCPCPGINDTCTTAESFYQAGGTPLETLLRIFGDMGLRYHDGTPRTAIYNIWTSYLSQPYTTNPSANESLEAIQVYPNPMRPSQGHTGINFTQLPPGTRLRIYTLAGEKVNDLTADAVGHATWDGTNQAGQKAASGVYLVYVQDAGNTKMLKVGIQR